MIELKEVRGQNEVKIIGHRGSKMAGYELEERCLRLYSRVREHNAFIVLHFKSSVIIP
jgi:hypothetical protein